MSANNSEPAAILKRQEALISRLRDPAAYPHRVESVRPIETHISHVLLTGAFAYKIKKAVSLGFLDFSTLAARRHFCHEELRLNRRLAPELYQEVVAIVATPLGPRVGAAGVAIEYAVKMREFPQEALLDRMLARGEVFPSHVDALAVEIARFHARVDQAGADSPYGTPAAIEAPMAQNFVQIRAMLVAADELAELAVLEDWSRGEHARLCPAFEKRHQTGCVRECHGDLHLGNIALVDGALRVFDCIEFNPNLRWIDTANETAFLMMDLISRGRPDFAARFLNDYLELGGDYGALALLRYYEVYRALVRAKIGRIRASQPDIDPAGKTAALGDYADHVRLAHRFTAAGRPSLIITHGLSGAGKTAYSQAVVEAFGAVRIRSDIERKRMHRLEAKASSAAEVSRGIYTAEATRRTYASLRELALEVLDAGYAVIVDAAFLKHWQRDLLRSLADSRRVPFVILSVEAPEALLKQRIVERLRQGADASEATLAVLDWQRRGAEPLRPDELPFVISIDAQSDSLDFAAARLRGRIAGGTAQGMSGAGA